ncbi:MAG: phasin family protein [Rhodospirillales bacterium]|nr:phasin family protein [Rhodospirillales bacterium]
MNSFQAAGFSFANPDLAKAWTGFRLPSLGIDALLQVHRNNAAALTNAGQVMFDGLKTLAQHQGESFKVTVDHYGKLASGAMAGASFEERTARQVDAARHICVSSVVRFQELSDIAVKTNIAAAEILNARVSSAFDEFRALFAAPVAPTTAAAMATPPVADEPPAAAEAVSEEEAIATEPPSLVEAIPDDNAVAAVEPEPADSAPTTAPKPKKAARSAKAARRPSSRR